MKIVFLKAWRHCLEKQKLLFVFLALTVASLFFSFRNALILQSDIEISLATSSLPLFFSLGIILGIGVLVFQHYYRLNHGRSDQNFLTLLKESFPVFSSSIILSLPLVLIGLCLLFLESTIYFLFKMPIIGQITRTFLPFLPLLFTLGSILLTMLAVLLLFFAPPYILSKKLRKGGVVHMLKSGIKINALPYLLIALLPSLFIISCFFIADIWVDKNVLYVEYFIQSVIQHFFLSLPYTIALTPCLIFFFHLSCECFLKIQSEEKAH